MFRLLKASLSLFFILVISHHLTAQQRDRYEGEYTYNNEDGTAVFSFYEGRDGEIIIDGSFNFSKRTIDTVDRTVLNKLNVIGRYIENQKDGVWRYDNETHRVELRDVVDFEVITDLESEDYELTAEYQKGILQGTWQYRENKFERNRIEPLFRSEPFTFQNNKIVGNISFEQFGDYLSYNINGRLNNQGVMVGEWEFTYMEDTVYVRETRRYEDGFLLGIRRTNIDTREVIQEVIYYDIINRLDRINQGEETEIGIAEERFGLEFSDGYREGFQEMQGQALGNEFLRHVLSRILQYDEGFVNEDGELIQYPIHTRRFEYPVSKEDRNNIGEIGEVFENLREEIEGFSTMNALAINRFRDDSLAFAYEYYQRRDSTLNQLEPIVEMLTSDQIRFINQENFTREGLPFLLESDTIRYDYSEEVREKVVEYSYEEDASLTSRVLSYIQQELEKSSQIGGYITSELEVLEQTDDLATLEARILERKAEVDSIYLNHEAISDRDLQMFESVYSNILQSEFNRMSQSYSELDTYLDRMQKGEVILDLINEMQEQFDRLAAVYPTIADIDELYQEETFNPFTYTRYNVRAKERLFDNGGMVLFIHYVRQLEQEEDYTQIKSHLDNIERLQERLIELRDQDTRRIERRLGRRTSINRIEAALDL
ncbi:hypothetical protein [Litoribacter ruber]|nr:hypothetical protein [Litoribacter ruber]